MTHTGGNLQPWPTDERGVRLCVKCGRNEADDADGLCFACWTRDRERELDGEAPLACEPECTDEPETEGEAA